MKDKLKEFFIKNKIAVIISAIVIVAAIVGVIIALTGKEKEGGQPVVPGDGTPVEYTLNVQTDGAMAFSDVNVYVYDGDASGDLIAAGKTDENGQFIFTTDHDTSTLGFVLQGLPEEGYKLKDLYTVNETKGEFNEQLYIYINTDIIPLEDMANTTFDLGSIIKDFTVTTPDGTEVTISKLLEEKDVVVLNFFYLACQPCMNEFPYLEEAYKQYSDNIAVIAMTPIDKDDAEIQKFIDERGITFYVAQCASEWEQMMELMAYPTTVVIDKWGMISFIHEGSVTEAGVFEAIFEYFVNSEKQHTVKYLEDIVNAQAEEGTEQNPIQILPDATEFDAEVAAGAEVYFEIPKVSNMIMTINDADAYVLYEEEKYEAVDGVVSVVISAPDSYTPAKFVIGNAGSSDKTFKAVLAAVQGSMMNPFVVEIGSITTEVPEGNEQGVYHTFTATESGTLTYKPVSVTNDTAFDVTLYNLNTYVNRTLSADFNEDGTVSVDVSVDDVVQIIVSTLPDENNEYPAATVTGELLFEAGEVIVDDDADEEVTYTVTVKDADGNVVSGVNVVIDTEELTTDASGKVTATLKSGSYAVGITPPEGFKIQGEVIVTADMPSVTVTLVSTTAKQLTYTVKVTDESGNALSGATVIIGNSVSTTNTSGTATFTLAEGSYDVTASASGYGAGSASVTKSSTSATIKLKKSVSASTDISYTVNVTNYKSEALEGVTVIFKSNGIAVATATTDSSGKATAKIASGSYDIALAYDGYGYDSSSAKVSSSSTSVTLIMAEISTTCEEVYFDESGAYKITTGAKYVEVPSSDANNEGGNAFFLFEPRKAGTYKISLSNANALISYWGGSTSYINDATFDTIHTNTTLTLNVAETGPTFVIGIKDTTGCIVTITRTGDAVTEMAWTDYVGTDTVSKYTFGSGTLTYVDITKSTSTYKLVYNSSDGYYHLGSASGPVMLVHLGSGAPYIALSDVIGFTGTGGSNFGKYIYDSNGTLTKKENYTSLLWKYMENMDETKSVYPLTKDLEYILKNGGEYRGWWATSGYGNSIYSAEPSLNSEIAWMWACCYVAQ